MTSYIVSIGQLFQHMKPTDTGSQKGKMGRKIFGSLGWKALHDKDFWRRHIVRVSLCVCLQHLDFWTLWTFVTNLVWTLWWPCRAPRCWGCNSIHFVITNWEHANIRGVSHTSCRIYAVCYEILEKFKNILLIYRKVTNCTIPNWRQ